MLRHAFLLQFIAEALAEVAVETSFGKLLGTQYFLRGCEQWLGIPYAKPPMGDLRFADPVAWDEHYPTAGRKATEYGPFCFQLTGGDEDCLFLNLWRPSKTAPGADLAAMIWIHGGGFEWGASSSATPGTVPSVNMYDGCILSSQHGVVVASMNYRLGPFGFTAFEDENGNSGNFGMKDQRLAFMWLRKELKAFGGSPAKITLFGESAGGMSIFHHVASPLSRGLFRAAISESGSPLAQRWELCKNLTRNFAAKVNCTDEASLRECLRSRDAKLLIQQAGETKDPFTNPSWFPCVDGVDMPDIPIELFRTGQTNSVPILAGTNTNEGNLIVWPVYEFGMSETQYKDYVNVLLNNHDPDYRLNTTQMAELFAKYPASQLDAHGDLRAMASSLITDAFFFCPTQLVGRYYGSISDFYLYRFNNRPYCDFAFTKLIPGVFHTIEVPYVWGDPWTMGGCIFTAQENALSNRIQTMWTNFAKHLDPSYQYSFPKYKNTSRIDIVLQTPEDITEIDYRGDYCQVWQNVLSPKVLEMPHSVPLSRTIVV